MNNVAGFVRVAGVFRIAASVAIEIRCEVSDWNHNLARFLGHDWKFWGFNCNLARGLLLFYNPRIAFFCLCVLFFPLFFLLLQILRHVEGSLGERGAWEIVCRGHEV
jgi:hypothetical protein